MCEKCQKVVDELLGDKTPKERSDILWGYTSWPFGSPEYLEKQIREYVNNPEKVIQEVNETYGYLTGDENVCSSSSGIC